MSIKYLSSHYLYSSAWMRLRVDKIELMDGSRSEYGVVERAPFVLIIASLENKILLVHQYRYPINSWTWEFPQGACIDGESIEQAARRELVEETGCVAGNIKVFNKLYEAAGFATHSFQVIEADIIKLIEPIHEITEEGMTSQWVELNDLKSMILDGKLQDAPSLAALSIYLLNRE